VHQSDEEEPAACPTRSTKLSTERKEGWGALPTIYRYQLEEDEGLSRSPLDEEGEVRFAEGPLKEDELGVSLVIEGLVDDSLH